VTYHLLKGLFGFSNPFSRLKGGGEVKGKVELGIEQSIAKTIIINEHRRNGFKLRNILY
jgi:hypothetical protein